MKQDQEVVNNDYKSQGVASATPAPPRQENRQGEEKKKKKKKEAKLAHSAGGAR